MVVRTKAFYVPQALIRLFSPQMFFREQKGGHGHFDDLKVMFCGADGDYLQFLCDWHGNVPFMHLDKEITQVGLTTKDMCNLQNPGFVEKAHNLLDENNFNLTIAQKELLLWHIRLCHIGFNWLQSLMRKCKNEHGEQSESAPIVTKDPKTSSVTPPKCPACLLGKQHCTSTGSTMVKAKSEMEMAIRAGDLRPGERVSMDQCACKVPG